MSVCVFMDGSRKEAGALLSRQQQLEELLERHVPQHPLILASRKAAEEEAARAQQRGGGLGMTQAAVELSSAESFAAVLKDGMRRAQDPLEAALAITARHSSSGGGSSQA